MHLMLAGLTRAFASWAWQIALILNTSTIYTHARRQIGLAITILTRTENPYVTSSIVIPFSCELKQKIPPGRWEGGLRQLVAGY